MPRKTHVVVKKKAGSSENIKRLEAKTRRALCLVILIFSYVAYRGLPQLFTPTTQLGENILSFTCLIALITAVVASFTMVVSWLAHLINELDAKGK